MDMLLVFTGFSVAHPMGAAMVGVPRSLLAITMLPYLSLVFSPHVSVMGSHLLFLTAGFVTCLLVFIIGTARQEFLYKLKLHRMAVEAAAMERKVHMQTASREKEEALTLSLTLSGRFTCKPRLARRRTGWSLEKSALSSRKCRARDLLSAAARRA